MPDAVDNIAREQIARVADDLREISRDMTEMQRQMAVVSEVLKNVVESQGRLMSRMDRDEDATHALEVGSAVARTRWAVLGVVVMLMAGAIGNLIASLFTKGGIPPQ